MFRLMSLAVAVAGCSGGGCSSCAGTGLGPIPGGYPVTPETRVARALQVRVTDQGLRNVSQLGGDLLLGATGGRLPIPLVNGNFGVGRYVVCRDGSCGLDLVLPSSPPPLELFFVAPDRIEVRARIGFRGEIPLHTCTLFCNSMCGGCADGIDTRLTIDTARGARQYIGLRTAIAIRRDTHPERRNYYRAELVPAIGAREVVEETPGEGFDDAWVGCSGGGLCGLLPVLRGTISGAFRGALGGALGPIQDALSQTSMPTPPGCPTGTRVDGARCRYSDGSLVPSLLGVELAGNVGGLLASVSPGVRAQSALVIAAGDAVHDAEVSPLGMTLNVFGVAQSQAHNTCVPRLMEPAVAEVPQWAALVSEPGSRLAVSFDALLGTAVGMLAGSIPTIGIPAIPVPGAMGMPVGTVNIELPEGGLRGVEEGGSRFLGLFMDLRYRRAARPDVAVAETEASVLGADPVSDTARVRVRVAPGDSAVSGQAHEYATRVDGMTWSRWAPGPWVDVTAPTLAMAGEHRVEVRARVVGEPESADPTPVELRVEMVTAAGAVALADERPRVAPTEDAVELIRGGRTTDAGASGCGCGVVGSGQRAETGWAWMVMGGVAAMVGRRRRRRGEGERRRRALRPAGPPRDGLPSASGLSLPYQCPAGGSPPRGEQ